MKILRNVLMASASAMILSACGATDIASPGAGGNVSIVTNNPAPTPTPTPTATPTPSAPLVTAASACPVIGDSQGLTDRGILTGTTGTYRVCALPARINTSSILPKVTGVLYNLASRVDVGTDQGPTPKSGEPSVTLTIQPGVTVIADNGPTWININRGNKIMAVGSKTQPIIFTSRANAEGSTTDSSSGQWGGIVLSGRAQITDCAAPTATPGTVACERQTEGAVDPALYGGATNTDNSGQLSYVQIRYSGYILSANSELQSLTTQGVGSGTVLDHIMSYNSSDDGAEFFGGHVNMKYYISVGAEDDNLDTDTGLKGNFQYVIVAQRLNATPQLADSIIEADSDNGVDGDNPRQNTTVSNFTFIDRVAGNSDAASILLRGGTDYTLANGVLVNTVSNPCLNVSRAQTASTTANPAIDEVGAPQFFSVAFSGCATRTFIGSNGPTDADVMALFTRSGSTSNTNASFTSTLTNLYVDGANEAAVPAYDATQFNGRTINGNLITPAGFFDKTTYIGAVKDASDTWYQGWTCNSASAGFGTGNSGACTTLPTA
ncbi:hypothetical protein [Sphingomonas oligophenolica]|uniref:Lipoprotein n=1 Tax=Sphingomonas oligophenolica TaxID=301154 RepID=A0A502CGV5_9SPHN|nr:hypothetical protein [Sphingomonas oligophenolica]TPG12397.1 hypothetical protein EAH84_09585 [Sphingomonas oligophenolica]